jgi:DNA-binding transcriptional LysR family regulator
MLDAHQLHVFLEAGESLNFSTAAKSLHMTQPSVSQHIQTLEQHFNAPLFSRNGRHVELTDAGQALLPLAREMVALSIRIDETMRSLKGDVCGHLMVGCSTTPGKYVLPHLLADFLRLHPNVQATCHVMSRQNAMQYLSKGDLHLALASVRDFSRDFEFRKFISDPIKLIVPLNHRWADRQEIRPDELLEENFILREEGCGTYNAMRDGLLGVGISMDQLRTVLTLGNSEAIALSVQEGIGVGFVSELIVKRLVKDGVAIVDVRGIDVSQDIFIGRHTHRPATAAQNAFWDFVTSPETNENLLPLTKMPFASLVSSN